MFSVEAVSYNMKTHDHLGKLSQVVSKLEDVEKVVVIPFVHEYVVLSLILLLMFSLLDKRKLT